MPIANEFEWRAMTAAINQIKPAPRFLQDTIFKTRNTNAAENIDVDVVIGGRKVLPFVSPVEGGSVVAKMGREMRSIKTPRIRPKKPFSAPELLNARGIGANLYMGSSGSVAAYRQAKVGQELAALRADIDTTIEYMCAKALTGTLTVSQDNVAFSVDYQVPGAHKPTAAADWAQLYVPASGEDDAIPETDIIADIDTWSQLIRDAIGFGPSLAICGKNAANAIRKNTAISGSAGILDNRRIEGGSLLYDANSDYLGTLNGIRLYRYGQSYTLQDGTTGNFVADDYFILVAPQARFSVEFGMIMDLEADAQIVSQYFSKSWIEKDPSALWVLAESRPLPVLWQPEAIVYAKVTNVS